MHPEFWLDKWKNNCTGFHQQRINPYLTKYWHRLELPPASQVFVPLCGKSLDMLWLHEQGHCVAGIEISELAVNQFFDENGLQHVITPEANFNRYEAAGITLWQGDFFKLGPNHVNRVKALFDRAALVALPPVMRQRYVRHLSAILPDQVKILLITFDYDLDGMAGPPFSVTEAEVRELYRHRFYIELIEVQSVLDQYPPFQAAGLKYLSENVYLLTAR